MPSRTTDGRTFLALLALSATLACAGCPHNRVAASPPIPFAPQPQSETPMNIAPDTDASPPQPAAPAPPMLSADAAAPRLNSLPSMKMPAPPPRPPAEQPSPQPVAEASHPPAPQISPQLSQQAQQVLERQMNDDLGFAERNLERANGRRLNPAQQALWGTARSFVQQARDAGRNGDWGRAQNLSHKARLASIDFVNSL